MRKGERVKLIFDYKSCTVMMMFTYTSNKFSPVLQCAYSKKYLEYPQLSNILSATPSSLLIITLGIHNTSLVGMVYPGFHTGFWLTGENLFDV